MYTHQTNWGAKVTLDGEQIKNELNLTTYTTIVKDTNLPYYFYNGCAVVYNNGIHIMGSAYNDSCKTSHYKWNGGNWTSVSTLPYNFYSNNAVVYNNEIHIFGSGTSGKSQKHYKWNGNSWIADDFSIPYDFYYGGAVVYNNEIHIMGSNMWSGDNMLNHYRLGVECYIKN